MKFQRSEGFLFALLIGVTIPAMFLIVLPRKANKQITTWLNTQALQLNS